VLVNDVDWELTCAPLQLYKHRLALQLTEGLRVVGRLINDQSIYPCHLYRVHSVSQIPALAAMLLSGSLTNLCSQPCTWHRHGPSAMREMI